MVIPIETERYWRAVVPSLFGTRGLFRERQFFHGPEIEEARDGFRMFQVHYMYCALYFYYYCISFTSDHQGLDPGSWGPLL